MTQSNKPILFAIGVLVIFFLLHAFSLLEDLIKYFLLLVLLIPFLALALEVYKVTKFLLIAVTGAAVVSLVTCLIWGGFYQRPNVATIYSIAFFIWPFALCIARILNQEISWTRLWITVPIMSWYVVNVSMQFYYPASGGGGGLGYGLGLVLGWFYMVPVFALIFLVHVGVEQLLRISKKRTSRSRTDRLPRHSQE